jgi:hypothetical protein
MYENLKLGIPSLMRWPHNTTTGANHVDAETCNERDGFSGLLLTV